MTDATAAQQEDAFRRFARGEAVPGDAVIAAVEQSGETVGRVEALSYGYFRKALLAFEDSNGRRKISKVAFHPVSAERLHNEHRGRLAAGWTETAAPHAGADGTVLTMVRQPGTAAGPATFFRRVRPPFSGPATSTAAEAFLTRLAGHPPALERASRLLRRAGTERIATAPSHGDFVYWNCLRNGAATGIVDYEAYSDCRVAGYDLCYWHVLPLARRAVRWGAKRAGAYATALVLPAVWSRRILRTDPALAALPAAGPKPWVLPFALTLAEHATQMSGEHESPDIVALIGAEALALRREVCAVYDLLLDRLAEAP